jgi:hypothetical protein
MDALQNILGLRNVARSSGGEMSWSSKLGGAHGELV